MAEYICVSFLYENKAHFKQLVFNEKKNRQKSFYKPYTKIISEKIRSIARGSIGTTLPNDAVGIEDPNEVYSSPEQNLGYRDATQLINQKMATGDIKGKEDKLRILKEFLKEISEVNDRVNETTLLTKDPPIKTLCKEK